MRRAQAADIDDELLCLSAEAERLEQFCRVGIWGGLEYPVRADDERRALNGIDGLHRASFFLDLENVVLVAIGHHGAFTKLKLLGRVSRGLHLHDVLFRKLFEPGPSEIALHLVGRCHDRAAIAGMRLDDLSFPFGIEQVDKTLGRFLRFHQIGVVGDDAQPYTKTGELPVHILVLGRVVRDVFRHVGCQNALAFPDDEMRGIG